MAGTKIGGRRARDKNIASDPDFYKRIGAIGGKRKTPDGGFGADKELASIAGSKGGRRSMRGYKLSVERLGILYYRNTKTNKLEKWREDWRDGENGRLVRIEE